MPEVRLAGLHATAAVLGVVSFLVGFALDQWTSYPATIPGYTASHMIPLQVVFGLVLVGTAAVGMGRTDWMEMWHASLWMLGGLLAGWLTLMFALVFAPAFS